MRLCQGRIEDEVRVVLGGGWRGVGVGLEVIFSVLFCVLQCILLSGEVELCPHGRDHQGEGVARGAREKGHKGVKLGDILRYLFN